MRWLYLFLLAFIGFATNAQTDKVDSLRQLLPVATKDARIDVLIALSDETFYKDTEESRSYITEALTLLEEYPDEEKLAKSYSLLGITYDIEGITDSSFYFFTKYYETAKRIGNAKLISNALNNLGMSQWNSGQFDNALKYFFQSLEIADSLKSENDMAVAYSNIGLIYQELNDYKRALNYNLKALGLRKKLKSSQLVKSYNNIGICYKNLGKLDSALYAYNNALAVIGANDNDSRSSLEHNIGNIYLELGDYKKAEEYVLRSYNYKDSNVANLLATSTLSEIYFLQSDAQKSIEYGLMAENYAQNNDNYGHLEDIYFNLSRAYALSGNMLKFKSYMELWDQVKDSLFSKESSMAYNQLEVRYETEKKEKELIQQEALIAEQNAALVLDRYILAFALILIILIVLIAILWRNRLKRKQELLIQNERVKAREAEINATIASQEKERTRFSQDLHDGFGQLISVLNMNIKNLQSDSSPDERDKIFQTSSKVIEDMYSELRNICFDLMPQTLVNHGLVSALNELSTRVNELGGVSIEFNSFGLENRLNDVQEISLYRITQEWLNNILKYSEAQKITLQITADEQEVTLLIEDNGHGFDKNELLSGKGNGWKNLNTRANLIGGSIEIETTIGQIGNVLIVNTPREFKYKNESLRSENTVTRV